MTTTTTKCQPTNYEETDPVDHSLFGPVAISNDDDFMKELTREWDERRHEATVFFRRVSFSGLKYKSNLVIAINPVFGDYL